MNLKNINIENSKFLERYRLYCLNKGLTPRSVEAIVDTDLRIYLQWLGDKKIDEVKHTDIQDFLLYCMQDRKNGSRALNRKHTNVNMFYKRLIRNEDINIKNPVDKVDKPKIRKSVRPYLSEVEYKLIINYLSVKKDLRGLALMSIFFSSGCRLSEIHQLNKVTLNFSTRRFLVTGKGEKERICLFSEDASKHILNYLDNRDDELDPLFISRNDTRLSKKSIQDYMARVGEKVNMDKRLHPHLIRHGRAMQLLKSGVKLETIQRLLGHESIATTQIYAHMNVDQVQDEIDRHELDIAC